MAPSARFDPVRAHGRSRRAARTSDRLLGKAHPDQTGPELKIRPPWTGLRPARAPSQLRAKIGLYLHAFAGALFLYGITIALSVLLGVPDWDALIGIPLYVLLGVFSARTLDLRRRTAALHAMNAIGAGVTSFAGHRCGWHVPLIGDEPAAAMVPVLLHLMTDCPDPEAAAFRRDHPEEAEQARKEVLARVDRSA